MNGNVDLTVEQRYMVKRAVRTMLHTDEQWKRMGWGIVKLLGVQGK